MKSISVRDFLGIVPRAKSLVPQKPDRRGARSEVFDETLCAAIRTTDDINQNVWLKEKNAKPDQSWVRDGEGSF